MAFSGTSVVAGRGEGIVVAIGSGTEVGRIAGGLSTRSRHRSPLQRELDRLVRILLVVAVALIAITTGLGFLRGNPLGDNLLAGISAAIAAIPEEPPILLAVVLGLGAHRLLKRGVLVRRLNAEEVLGAVDLIVTDKTGTLTMNRLEVASLSGPHGLISDPAARLRLLTDALRAEDDAWLPEPGGGVSSFTHALVRALERDGGDTHPDPGDLIATEPATNARPFSSTQSRRDGTVESLVIGAPEAVAAHADAPADERESWRLALQAAAERGERVVGVAGRIDDGKWTLRGLIGFADALRPGVAEAMQVAVEAGVQLVRIEVG